MKNPESAEQKEKTIFQIFPIFIFQVYFSDFYLHACKTLKPGFFWYAVDTNLFRLGSTNPKKKFQTLVLFFRIFFLQKCSNIFEQTFFFFSKVFKFKGPVPRNDKQIPPPLSFDPTFMKDAQLAEQNQKNTKKNSPIFIFRVIVKNSSQIGVMTLQK